MSLRSELKILFSSLWRIAKILVRAVWRTFKRYVLTKQPKPPAKEYPPSAACKTERVGSYVTCKNCNFKEFA